MVHVYRSPRLWSERAVEVEACRARAVQLLVCWRPRVRWGGYTAFFEHLCLV